MTAGIVDAVAVMIGRRVDSDEFEAAGVSGEWIRRRMGIDGRRWLDPETPLVEPAAQACRALAERSADDAGVGALILVSSSAPRRVPGMAQEVALRAGLPPTVLAFDLNAVCTGFPYGLATALALVDAGHVASAVVCAAEAWSRLIDPNDRKTGPLFADGVAAVLVAARDGFAPCLVRAGCDGEFREVIHEQRPGQAPPGIHMDGGLVYQHAVRHMSELAVELAGHEPRPTVFVPHQANGRMLATMGEDLAELGIPVVNRIAEAGNTSSATIPLAFAAALADGELPLAGRLGAIGYGSGEAWGAVSVSYRLDRRPVLVAPETGGDR